jgi:YVTN family beta-propeller protein
VSVIDTASNQMAGTIPVGYGPIHIAITPNGRRAYVANHLVQGDLSIEDAVSVIDTAANRVVATVPVGVDTSPIHVAISPDGSRAYVASENPGSLSIIDTASNQVVATLPLGRDTNPLHVAITPDGSRAYIANVTSDTVSVLDTASSELIATVAVGARPMFIAFGLAPRDGSAADRAREAGASGR